MISLEPDQIFHLVVSGLIFLVLAVGHHSSKRKISAWYLLLAGIAITGIGVCFPCVEGRNCFEVITFKDTGGMGRAYVYGIGVILAAMYAFIFEVIKRSWR